MPGRGSTAGFEHSRGEHWWYVERQASGADGEEDGLLELLASVATPGFVICVTSLVLAQLCVGGYILWRRRRVEALRAAKRR